MRYDDGEDHRLKTCPVCGCRVGIKELFTIAGKTMCEGCGRDEINRCNNWVREADATPTV